LPGSAVDAFRCLGKLSPLASPASSIISIYFLHYSVALRIGYIGYLHLDAEINPLGSLRSNRSKQIEFNELPLLTLSSEKEPRYSPQHRPPGKGHIHRNEAAKG